MFPTRLILRAGFVSLAQTDIIYFSRRAGQGGSSAGNFKLNEQIACIFVLVRGSEAARISNTRALLLPQFKRKFWTKSSKQVLQWKCWWDDAPHSSAELCRRSHGELRLSLVHHKARQDSDR